MRFLTFEPEESIETFIDPVTKPYVESLLQDKFDQELCNKTKLLLKKIHRQYYRVLLTKKKPTTNSTDTDQVLEEPMPPPTTRKRLEFSMTTEYKPKTD